MAAATDERLIYEILSAVGEIPEGNVATYGQIARLIGRPKNARLVGRVLSQAERYGDYPCHRVVDHSGRLVPGWDAQAALLARLGAAARRLDTLAPTHLRVPSGSNIRIDYTEAQPAAAVRIQEVFGMMRTPSVAGGRVRVLLKLLSPAQRPVQITADLESFWKNGYPEVRKDLRGRYPRHYWPEDPSQAEPTRRVRPR